MNVDFIQQAQTKNRHQRCRIVLPESTDERILQAAIHASKSGIAEIILIGEVKTTKQQLNKLDGHTANIQIIDPLDSVQLAAYAAMLFEHRSAKGLSQQQAQEWVKSPLCFANCMVRADDADACIAGAQLTSSDVVRSALQIVGTENSGTRLSSCFVLQGAHLKQPVVFADCAINITPDAEQLADIAYQSAQSTRKLLGIEPNVALLSFSTNGSAQHADALKVQQASQLLTEQFPELNVLGEIQFDAAFNTVIRNKKWPGAANQEAANVFIFPSLEAGNIGYKIAEQIGGAVAIGPILQGLAKPVNDLSRGATTDAILQTIAATALQI